jgi:pimeloyl-ACP methyl ester carboxylesterase
LTEIPGFGGQNRIPYEDFGGLGPSLHFAHANGYPPSAYRPLLGRLSEHYRVLAMRMRPLWPSTEPALFSDWQVLADDLDRFLDQQALDQVIGVGHSMGATTTLRLALRRPQRFRSLVLIDPVIFPPAISLAWDLIFRLGLAYRLHPLVKGALRRRTCFENRSVMFDNYRKKVVFSRMNDENLQAYVDALACPDPQGQIQLCYPPEWEARIYVTGIRADRELWRQLPGLVPPVLFLRGSQTDTFLLRTARLVQNRLKTARLITIPDSTHLVALERPAQVSQETIQFLSEGF